MNDHDATLALVTRCFTALNAGDREAKLAYLADDVVQDLDQAARERGQRHIPPGGVFPEIRDGHIT